jgi:cytochrome c oxidase subunit II
MFRGFPCVIVLICLACGGKIDVKEDQKRTTASSLSGNAESGKELFNTCKSCHGDAGQGDLHKHAPALTNIDSWYLYRQLKNFNLGIRGYLPEDTLGVQMASMAKVLKDTVAMLDVMAFIETLPEVSIKTELSGDIRKGERIYETICGSCHGQKALGNELMHAPRLNGLDEWYLQNQINKFKSGLRGNHPADTYGAPMVPMMALLKDDQSVSDIIAYIRSTIQIQSQ